MGDAHNTDFGLSNDAFIKSPIMLWSETNIERTAFSFALLVTCVQNENKKR